MTALLSALIIAALSPAERFESASDVYHRGEFDEAVSAYEGLVAEGFYNAAVLYNLGNAYFRAGNYSQAAVNYERALHLAPHFDAARTNLGQAMAELGHANVEPALSPWERRWSETTRLFAPRTLWWTAAVLWTAGWLILGLRLWRPMRAARGAAAVAAAAGLLLGALAWTQTHTTPYALVVAPAAPVYYVKSEDGAVRFRLEQGERVKVEQWDEAAGWLQVTGPGGERGWTPSEHLALITPPYGSAPHPDAYATGADQP